MSVSLQFKPCTRLFELHIRGIIRRSELTSCENELVTHVNSGIQPRMLVALKNFGGWARGEDRNHFDFTFTNGEKIVKMAIVGAGPKEAEVKALTGAGSRPTPVRFFPAEELAETEAWLLE